MKLLLALFVLFYSNASEARIASEEGVTPILQDRPKIQLECKLRSLEGDPYPSVVVKWLGENQRLTWNSKGEVTFERNFKLPSASHSYPSSGGLSGDSTTAKTTDPFADSEVVSDDNVWEDIVTWFTTKCTRPY